MKLRLSVVAVLLALILGVIPCLARTAGESRAIEMLVRGGPESQRDVAQSIYNGIERSPEVLDIAAEVLLQTYRRSGFVQIDATSWLCKALGASGNGRYRRVLEEVADQAVDKKVRKYATQALGMLPANEAAPYLPGTVDLAKLRDGAITAQEQPPTRTQGGPPTRTQGGPPATGDTGTASFDRISHGMSMEEVFARIGQPTATTSRVTGKAWAPFYYGGDTARMFALYKGKGRIVFSNASRFAPVWRVIDIVHDPTESGYP
jgi:hypothetical protein